MKGIYLKTYDEVEKLRRSNDLLGRTLAHVATFIKEGVTTAYLDKVAYDFIIQNGGKPACLHYNGYPYTLCTSINEQVVHGMPDDKTILRNGDIISVDTCVELDGFIADSAYTFPVGHISEQKRQLLKCTKECLCLGIENAVTGKRIGDIAFAIQQHAEKNGFSVIRDFVGHGIGKHMHEPPEVPNYGKRGTGIMLKEGMTLAIEPMIALGSYNVTIADDGWTATTTDKQPAAHFELSVCVKNNEVDILSTFKYIQEVMGPNFI